MTAADGYIELIFWPIDLRHGFAVRLALEPSVFTAASQYGVLVHIRE